jgi:hypothetical protein
MNELASTIVCSNGHVSDDRGRCSVCGVRIASSRDTPGSGGVKAASTPTVPRSAPPAPSPRESPSSESFEAPGSSEPSGPASAGSGGAAPAAGASQCPYCSSELDPGSRFCEVCGYDPATGSMPAAPVPQPVLLPPAPLPTVPTAPPRPSHPTPVPSPPATPTPSALGAGRLVVVVTTDRAYYDSQQVGEVQFPVGAPPRAIELPAGPATIGRRSRTLGTEPAIDLAVPPEDPAVSHTHASLLPSDDGTWSLVDHGSTNGTYVNESPEPLAANVPRTVRPGDRIYVGAWTRITLEQRPLL